MTSPSVLGASPVGESGPMFRIPPTGTRIVRAMSGSGRRTGESARPCPPAWHFGPLYLQGTGGGAPGVPEPRRPSSCSALWVYFHLPAVTVSVSGVTLSVSSFTLIQAYPLQSDCSDRSSCLRELRSLVVRVRCLSQALRAFLSAVCRSVDVPVNVLWRDFEPATAVYGSGSFPVVVGVAVGVVVLTDARGEGETAGNVPAAAGSANFVVGLALVEATGRVMVGLAAVSVCVVVAGLACL